MNTLQLHARTGATGVARQAHSRSAQHAACSFHGVHRSQPLRRRVDSAFFGGRKLQLAASSTPRVARGAVAVEANIFGRVSRVFRSYMNAIVSKAEDPEKILEQAVNDMQGDLIKMRQASAQVMASQKQLDVKYSQAQQTADEWYRRAELALNKGDDDLAREALKRRKAYADNAAQMKAQVEQQRKATDQLISNTRMLEQKLAEAKSKKDTLKARAKSASASKQITEMIQGLNTSNALEGDSVDNELAAMKSGRSLKGGNGSKAQLPEGRPYDQVFKKDAIDEELDQLRRRTRE